MSGKISQSLDGVSETLLITLNVRPYPNARMDDQRPGAVAMVDMIDAIFRACGCSGMTK